MIEFLVALSVMSDKARLIDDYVTYEKYCYNATDDIDAEAFCDIQEAIAYQLRKDHNICVDYMIFKECE